MKYVRRVPTGILEQVFLMIVLDDKTFDSARAVARDDEESFLVISVLLDGLKGLPRNDLPRNLAKVIAVREWGAQR